MYTVEYSKFICFQIHLPTGARLELTLDQWNKLLNVKIYPSVRDVDKTRGMCGTLSSSTNNVMIKRGGQTTTSFDDFVESWRYVYGGLTTVFGCD